jgi:uncharacterized protein
MADVRDNPAESRYELDVDGNQAIAAYSRDGDVLVFTHTRVPEALQGHGVGSELIHGVLHDVDARGLKLVPQCPFVEAYLEKHPEWRGLVA